MNVPLAVILVANLLALTLTLSVVLLSALWRNWRTDTGRALFHLLFSLIVLQGSTLLTHLSLLASLPRHITVMGVNLTLLGFFLLMMATQTVLLRAAHSLAGGWQLLHRSGWVALVVLQPAVWEHSILRLPDTLDHDLFGSPYTTLGGVLLGFSLCYLALTVFAGWSYWRRVDAPTLTTPLLLMTLTQIIVLVIPSVRIATPTGIIGGSIGGFLGFYLILQHDLTPRSPSLQWVRALNTAAIDTTGFRTLPDILTTTAGELRRLLRADVVNILLANSPDRLDIIATNGGSDAVLGRQIAIGDGLSGRVMQTLQAMRVDNYGTWDGRAAGFEDLPYCASMSIPLLYDSTLIGVVNTHELTPGRTYTDQDQALVTLIEPLLSLNIVKARIAQRNDTLQATIDALMTRQETAILIFNAAGTLRDANAVAQHMLHTLFSADQHTLTIDGFVGRADDSTLRDTWHAWTADPGTPRTCTVEFPTLGHFAVHLRAILTPSAAQKDAHQPDVLVTLHKRSAPDSASGPKPDLSPTDNLTYH